MRWRREDEKRNREGRRRRERKRMGGLQTSPSRRPQSSVGCSPWSWPDTRAHARRGVLVVRAPDVPPVRLPAVCWPSDHVANVFAPGATTIVVDSHANSSQAARLLHTPVAQRQTAVPRPTPRARGATGRGGGTGGQQGHALSSFRVTRGTQRTRGGRAYIWSPRGCRRPRAPSRRGNGRLMLARRAKRWTAGQE
jgi:hypothetical protein